MENRPQLPDETCGTLTVRLKKPLTGVAKGEPAGNVALQQVGVILTNTDELGAPRGAAM